MNILQFLLCILYTIYQVYIIYYEKRSLTMYLIFIKHRYGEKIFHFY